MQPILVVRETAPWSRRSVRAFFCVCCAACLRCVCASECVSSPLGQEHTQAPLLWDPPRLFVIRESSEMPLRSFQTRIRQSWTCARVCVCVRLSVFCQRRRQTPDFSPRLCLSHLLPAPSVMPTCGSSASPPSPPPPPTVSALFSRADTPPPSRGSAAASSRLPLTTAHE